MSLETTNICIWGDSIAYGAWDAGGGWVDRLRRFAYEEMIRSDFEKYFWIYNLGIPGDTTHDVLNRFDFECAAREPHAILFALGANDSSTLPGASSSRVPLPEYEDNVKALLDKASAASARVFWLGPVMVDEDAWNARAGGGDARFRHRDVILYNEALGRLAREADIPFLDMQNTLAREDLHDGLHPNTEGHEKIFLSVKDFFAASGVL